MTIRTTAIHLLIFVAPVTAFVASPRARPVVSPERSCSTAAIPSISQSAYASATILPKCRAFVDSAQRRMSGSDSGQEGVQDGVDFDSLMDMDIVIFSKRQDSTGNLEMGALQEDGTLAPLSAWTLESAFSGGADSIEFLVDEEERFPGLTADDITIHSVLDESLIGYGSRQVGGGKGPGNPHGEESELLYYVDRQVLDKSYEYGPENNGERQIDVAIKPDLEILW